MKTYRNPRKMLFCGWEGTREAQISDLYETLIDNIIVHQSPSKSCQGDACLLQTLNSSHRDQIKTNLAST